LGAALNFGVSFLYQALEFELGRIHQKLKVLEDSAILVKDKSAFLRETRTVSRQIEIAAKSLSGPRTWLVRALVASGAYCVSLLIYAGFEPKICNPFLQYTGIIASVVPIPLGWSIHRWFVQNALQSSWKQIAAIEQKYFS